MKIVGFVILLFSLNQLNSQSLPIDFESSVETSDFIDFDGGSAMVIANPQSNGINTSSMVAQIVRDGGTIWSGSKINLPTNLEFETMNTISMKIFTTAPVGTTVKFKLEGSGTAERDVLTTVTNEWETLIWDFTGVPSDFNSLVFMFDFGNVGDGSENSTFLFDDIEQLFGGFQIDFPVNFEDSNINYSMSDFGGNVSSLVMDPEDLSNNVIQSIKTNAAATWAGTTIGTPAGFATDLPLSLTDSKMTVRVWSPEAGIPIRLKVEDSNDPTHTCETETNTTVSGAWETIEFDFVNQALGTESLSIGLGMGWTYNMASIFFNFGTDGASAGEMTYYFDEVQFGALVSSLENLESEELRVFPNPSNSQWTIRSTDGNITLVEVFDLQGRLLKSIYPNSNMVVIDVASFENGTYISRVLNGGNSSVLKLFKK